MKIVEIAGLRFGQGLPKICVPLTGSSAPALLRELQTDRALPADLFEWRIDRFFGDIPPTLKALREGLWGKPLLCTVRTQAEGGALALSPESYEEMLSSLLGWGGFEFLDVELSCGDERVRRLTEKAREQGVGTVVSQHDFQGSPSEKEMVGILVRMKELGADLPKLAVTPQSPRDVLALLSATLEASERVGPVITMSMGPLGKLSRVSGEAFGSCLTFGAGRSASAPGQMNAEDLRAILEDLSPGAN